MRILAVIPGRAERANPESSDKSQRLSMGVDSGFALRAPRNDG
jgi:hypothetical protein